ncbi:MAG: aminomethyltransferase beta-barrel domain-containing protein, partial [Terriglobales bacterium]
GVHNFTVGQRKGLGVATGSPLYVLEIKGNTRQVVVGNQEDLYSKTLRVNKVNLISVQSFEEPMIVEIKIRHRHQAATATIEMTAHEEALITFNDQQRAITPGQAAVFYKDEVVVGGGWIV